MFGSVVAASSSSPAPPPEEDSIEAVGGRLGHEHWRTRALRMLHNHHVVLILVGLIFVDILLLVIVLVVESAYPGCAVVEYHCTCEPAAHCREQCNPTPANVAWLIETCNVASCLILVVFLLEVGLHIASLGRLRWFLVVDFAIITFSLALELYVMYVSQEFETAEVITIPLLLLSRSWRLFRLGHSAFEDARRVSKEETRAMREEIAALKQELLLVKHNNSSNGTMELVL